MQVLFAGGTGEFCSNSNTSASSSSYLVNLTPGASHDLVTEEMAFPRVVCDISRGLQLCNPHLSCIKPSLYCSKHLLNCAMPDFARTALHAISMMQILPAWTLEVFNLSSLSLLDKLQGS